MTRNLKAMVGGLMRRVVVALWRGPVWFAIAFASLAFLIEFWAATPERP